MLGLQLDKWYRGVIMNDIRVVRFDFRSGFGMYFFHDHHLMRLTGPLAIQDTYLVIVDVVSKFNLALCCTLCASCHKIWAFSTTYFGLQLGKLQHMRAPVWHVGSAQPILGSINIGHEESQRVWCAPYGHVFIAHIPPHTHMYQEML